VTFWKNIVFKKYKKNDVLGIWVMKNAQRKILSSRIKNITPVIGMKKLKDPTKKSLKGINLFYFILFLYEYFFKNNN